MASRVSAGGRKGLRRRMGRSRRRDRALGAARATVRGSSGRRGAHRATRGDEVEHAGAKEGRRNRRDRERGVGVSERTRAYSGGVQPPAASIARRGLRSRRHLHGGARPVPR